MEVQGTKPLRICDSSSDSDSESESNWKKKSIRSDGPCSTNGDGNDCARKKKAHEMWTEKLQEQTLLEGFGQCKLKQPSKSVYDRGCEAYDFDAKASYPKTEEDNSPSESEKDMDFGYDYNNEKNTDDAVEEFGVIEEKKKIKMPKVKERLGEKSFGKFSIQKVADKIVHALKEKKPELIQRCVQFLGPKKALELLSMTLTLEEAGGLMTKDGSRRRTPGGVYIQLLRDDPHVRKDLIDKIFQDEKKSQNDMKKAFRKMVRKQKLKKLEKAKEVNPFTITANSELATEKKVVSENARLSDVEEGEIMD